MITEEKPDIMSNGMRNRRKSKEYIWPFTFFSVTSQLKKEYS